MISYGTVSDFYWSADCPEADLSDLPTWPSFAWADLRPLKTLVCYYDTTCCPLQVFFSFQHPCYFTKFNCRYINKFGKIDQTALQFLVCKHHCSRYLLSQIMLHPRCKILPNNNSNGMRWRHMPAVDVRESSCARASTNGTILNDLFHQVAYRGNIVVVKLCP